LLNSRVSQGIQGILNLAVAYGKTNVALYALSASDGPQAILTVPAALYGFTSASGQAYTGGAQVHYAITGQQGSQFVQHVADAMSTPLSSLLTATGIGSQQTVQGIKQVESNLAAPGNIAETTDWALSMIATFTGTACHK
jgi:hypothetical protein